MKETKDSSQRLTKAEKSWILYDVANSAFIMIVTATIPIYFRSLAEGSGMSGTSATSLWGSATSISILILALLSPVLGAIADYENMKKKILCLAMAAIMVGGMVPPIGIALACQFFPKKFTKEERGSKVSNFVMGASFITEGAIPFAAADPLHVIPCTLIGAGVAGFLSALFKCTLMAPHGGIFVFATVGHPLLYILAWAVGAVITAVLLGLIKKDVK